MSFKPGMYIGIDLGTTNTVVAQVTVDLQGKFNSPLCLRIDQQTDEYGNQEQHELLPSAVHIPPDGPPIVGKYAHERMVKGHTSDVISWWKNHIGLTDEQNGEKIWRINGQKWSAVDAAAAVLKHVRQQLEYQYPNALKRPVVTVPASFPESMKRATREAIRQAGWLAEEEEPLLLYEPIAALMGYLVRYEQEQLALPPQDRSPDWGQGGRVIVYDIGGGTVDVTLVRLEPYLDPITTQPRLRARVEDYAPHTLLGGFKFDEVFAKALVEKFCREHELTVQALPKTTYNFLFFTFRSWAETAKKRLAAGKPYVSRGFGIPKELKLNRPMWRCRVTQEEYLAAIAPLLGPSATVETGLPGLEWRFIGEADHVMEPIIRLLQAQQLSATDISAVLLIGGMGYLPPLRKRLERFFGPQTVLLWKQVDPMKAVAYGAALHNAQLANDRSVHEVILRQASLRVFQAATQRAVWQDLIPPQTSLPYGERFEYTKRDLYFPAGEREVQLKMRYGGVMRRGIRFQLPEQIPLGQKIPFICQVAVDSHSHILTLQASLRDHPEVTVQAILDETPERGVVQEQSRIPDPEANRETKDVPSLLRQLSQAHNSRIAAIIRKELERAIRLGRYVEQVIQVVHTGRADGQLHACVLLSRIFERYTYKEALNSRTPTVVARVLQKQQPLLISQLEQILSNTYHSGQMRAHAAFALGWVGLWEAERVNISLLLSLLTHYHKGLQVEAARAVGRTVTRQEHWEQLLRMWQHTLPAGAREAIIWAIARSITRRPNFVSQVQLPLLTATIEKLLDKGTRDMQQNPAVEIASWRAIALLTLTADIEQEQPLYAQKYPKLLHKVRQQLQAEQTRIVTGRTDLVQQGVRNATMWVQQALNGEQIAGQMKRELEPSLPWV